MHESGTCSKVGTSELLLSTCAGGVVEHEYIGTCAHINGTTLHCPIIGNPCQLLTD